MKLIDADDIPYTMLYKENWMKGCGEEAQGAWKRDIDKMPTIDAVPVVRCKDCKHRKTCVCPMQEAEFNEWECDFEYYDYTEDDGYCHRGERKDDEHTD